MPPCIFLDIILRATCEEIMYCKITKFKYCRIWHYHNLRKAVRQGKLRQPKLPQSSFLLLAEGHAVGALIHVGVSFMSANQDMIQGAVICILTMVCALSNSALNALVCITIHSQFLLLFKICFIVTTFPKIIQPPFKSRSKRNNTGKIVMPQKIVETS